MTKPDDPREPRWERRPDDRRKEIIQAAFEVFGELGYARATLADIARRAGVSPGTVSFYFGAKAELFAAIIADRYQAFAEHEEALLLEHRGCYRELLLGSLRRGVERLRSPGELRFILVSKVETASFPEPSRRMMEQLSNRFLRLYAALLRGGIEAGEFREVPIEETAAILRALVIGSVMYSSFCTESGCAAPDAERFITTMTELVDRALLLPQAAPAGADR